MTTPDEIGWGELIEDDNPRCVACGGELRPLGMFGHRLHFRCRSCGHNIEGEIDVDSIMRDDCLTSPFDGLDELVENPDEVDEEYLYELAREEEALAEHDYDLED